MTSEGCLRENCFIFVSFSDEMWWHVAGPCSAKYFACDDVSDDVITTSAKNKRQESSCLQITDMSSTNPGARAAWRCLRGPSSPSGSEAVVQTTSLCCASLRLRQ